MGIRRLLTTSVLAVATVLAGAMTAGAAPAEPDQPTQRPPRASLQLTLIAGQAVTGRTLTCGPDGGSHRHAARACALLRRAGGDPDKVQGRPRPCTTEYMPVRATANGHWQGRPVAWERVYGNRCELDVATIWVFRF